METLKKLYDEKQVDDLAKAIILKTKTKFFESVDAELFSSAETFLYDIYTNNKDKIERELIKEITEQFVNDPSQYKFAELRANLFKENKDVLVKQLTNDGIKNDIDNILMDYTHRKYMFHWKYKDGLVSFMLSNWDRFKDDERIKLAFGNELQRLRSLANQLREKLNKLEGIDDN